MRGGCICSLLQDHNGGLLNGAVGTEGQSETDTLTPRLSSTDSINSSYDKAKRKDKHTQFTLTTIIFAIVHHQGLRETEQIGRLSDITQVIMNTHTHTTRRKPLLLVKPFYHTGQAQEGRDKGSKEWKR